tara:strand:+ start:95 stop:331 length:237 start_codon:yes stop_codon:yes gene_type:complete
MVMNWEHYNEVAERIFDTGKWHIKTKNDFDSHCSLAKAMADMFERDSDNFQWKDFVANSGCFGEKKKRLVHKATRERF